MIALYGSASCHYIHYCHYAGLSRLPPLHYDSFHCCLLRLPILIRCRLALLICHIAAGYASDAITAYTLRHTSCWVYATADGWFIDADIAADLLAPLLLFTYIVYDMPHTDYNTPVTAILPYVIFIIAALLEPYTYRHAMLLMLLYYYLILRILPTPWFSLLHTVDYFSYYDILRQLFSRHVIAIIYGCSLAAPGACWYSTLFTLRVAASYMLHWLWLRWCHFFFELFYMLTPLRYCHTPDIDSCHDALLMPLRYADSFHTDVYCRCCFRRFADSYARWRHIRRHTPLMLPHWYTAFSHIRQRLHDAIRRHWYIADWYAEKNIDVIRCHHISHSHADTNTFRRYAERGIRGPPRCYE